MSPDSRIKFDSKKPCDQAQGRHQRRSIRLPAYDYSAAGAYFVTMVTYQRACLFGEIVNGEMVLNDLGQIADEGWRAIRAHFPFVELSAHVIMLNHAHGIFVIRDDGRGTPWRAPTPQFGKTNPDSLANLFGQYQSSVSRIIKKQLNTTGIWQRNYRERIIRNARALDKSWRASEANPAQGETDEENSSVPHSGFAPSIL